MEALHTLFFAQIMGVYLIIMSIIMLARKTSYQHMVTHIKAESTSMVVAASFGLILGLLVVMTHNIWIFESEVLVTLIGWGMVIKSILWLSFPEMMSDMARKAYGGVGYYVMVLFMAVIGITLTAHGYYLFGLA